MCAFSTKLIRPGSSWHECSNHMTWSDVQDADATSSQAAHVLMADLNIAPGMEGAPVLTADGAMVGVLTVPLCHRHFQAEVRLGAKSAAEGSGLRQSWTVS